MYKRRIRAALAVTHALCVLSVFLVRLAPAARADATPNYEQLWIDQQALMQAKWTPTAGLGLTKWGEGSSAPPMKKERVWHVKTVEELVYALNALNYIDDSDSISIDENLDFNGVTGKKLWDPVDFGGERRLCIEGNGKTLYNLKVDAANKRNSSFVMNLGNDSEIRNLTFKNVILNAPAGSMRMMYPDEQGNVDPHRNPDYDPSYARAAALFADIYRDRIVIENVGVENALVSTTGYWAFAFMMTSKEQALTGDNFGSVTINNCYTKNVVCYAPGDDDLQIACTSAFLGGGLGGTDGSHGVFLNRSFAVDGMVISGSGHSGGFSSCNSGNLSIQNCFSDVVVYGTKTTGAFQGVMHQGTYLFDNCFALGSVEGEEYIGGFAATYQRQRYIGDYTTPGSITFRNCYSGAITGMVGGGKKMGSFIGAASYMASMPSVDFPGPDLYRFENCYAMGETGNIDLDVSDATGNPGTVGGFIGDEWTITRNGTEFIYVNCYYDKQTTAMREWAVGTVKTKPGITGVLTTDTAKAGRGLAGAAGTGGFSDFPEALPDKPAWYYEAGRYPELTAFRDAAEADWRDPYLVRAYSAASVAAVHLDPWADLATLPRVYDTVRDLTVGFAFSTGVQWRQIPNPHRTANAVTNPPNPTVTLYGEALPVLTLETKGAVTYGRNPAPGIQWLSANAVVNGRVGQRRLRVIPTANLHPGKSAFILTGKTDSPYAQIYDHADDVFMAYSSGKRLYDSDMLDITQGIYPDTFEEDSPQGRAAAKSTGEDISGEIGKCIDAATPNLVAGSSISVEGIRLAYTENGRYVDHLKAGEIEGGSFGNVDNLGLDNTDTNPWNGLFTGKEAFTNAELGLYALRYRWTLPDRRYLEGGKLVNVLNGLSDVEIRVVDMDGNAVDTEMILGIQADGDPALTGAPCAKLTKENIAYGTKTVAGWKHIADQAAIREIEIDIGRDHFGAAATQGNMRVTRRYYTNFYMERDRMFVTPVDVNKDYELSPPGGARFLRLDKRPVVSEIPEFAFRDLEEDVRILIRLRVRQIYVNLRQIVRTPATVSLPVFGYGKLNGLMNAADLAEYAQSLNVVFPTYAETVNPLERAYKRYRLPLKAFYRIEPIIPQYYEIEGLIHDLSPTGTANETTDPSLVLDYRTKDEYWVTVWLQSKLTPNPNNSTQVTPNAFPAFTPEPTATPKP